MKTKVMVLVLALAMILSLVAGCGQQGSQSTPQQNGGSASAEPSSAETDDTQSMPVEDKWQPGMFPLPGETRELTMWTTASNDVFSAIDTLANHVCIKACEEATNIHVEFQEIATSAAVDSYNVMAASGEYCDVIKCNTTTVTGGLGNAYGEGIIIDIAEYIPEYAPNYYACIQEKDITKDVSTDGGEMLAFYNIYENFVLDKGLVIRQDLLNGVDKDVPVTLDEYTDALTAIKVKYDISDPWWLQGNDFSGQFMGGVSGGIQNAFGVNWTFYQEDGKVYYSWLQDEMYDYIEFIRSWYEAGIINNEWYGRPDNPFDEANQKLILDGETGVWNGSVTDLSGENLSTVGGWKITACAKPVLNEGDMLEVGDTVQKVNSRGFMCAVSSQCDQIDVACEWADWWFTDEGMIVANYGIEGETYTIEDGEYVYTDLVANNPDMVYSIARGVYCYMAQTACRNDMLSTCCILNDEGLNALDLWLSNVDGSKELPGALSLAPDESSDLSTLTADIYTYVNENAIKFIVGEYDLNKETWKAFTDEISGMNVEHACEIYEAALIRYNNR